MSNFNCLIDVWQRSQSQTMEYISKIFKIQNSPSLQIKELSEKSKNLEKLRTPHSCLIPWKIAELKMLCPNTEQNNIDKH